MPSITPSYLYSFIAIIAVSSLLVISFMTYTGTIRFSSEIRQLKNLMDSAAAKSTELLTITLTTNATTKSFIQMPATIGNKQYWLRLTNDSSGTWVEGGLGNVPYEGTDLRVCLPREASATGSYIGGYGSALFECHQEAGVPQIRLSSSHESE